MKKYKSLLIVPLMLALFWLIQVYRAETKAPQINRFSIAQVHLLEKRISQLKVGMSEGQVFSVLGLSKNEFGLGIGNGERSNYHTYYSLRAGTSLVLVYDFTKQPRFKGAKIMHR